MNSYPSGDARYSLGDLLALTPVEFESVVGDLLTQLGYRDVHRVGGAGDLGVDLVCTDMRGQRVGVQCKRYAPGVRVGTPALQQFIGMLRVHHGAEQGIFVTTSIFTDQAHTLADQHGIQLIDGALLVQMMQEPSRYSGDPSPVSRSPLRRGRTVPTALVLSQAVEAARAARR